MTVRRYDLDWLRIIAFGLLILYHCGMFYVTWGWHVKSSYASDAIEPLMMLTNPWRLTLLFLVSGAATRFMADKMSAWKLTSSRMGRLWPPLLLAVFVIVPPQSYYEVVEAIQALPPEQAAQYPLALDNFYVKYVTASGDWCDNDGCLTTPTYNHMWFVAYLILYTLALIPLLPLLRRIPKAVSVLIAGPFLIITPWLIMAALRVTLYPIFGESHDFREDGYLHVLYFGVFLFGFAVAKSDAFFARCMAWRWPALGIALVCWASLIVYFNAHPEGVDPPEWLRFVMRGVRELDAWCAIVAALGFAHRHLRNANGPARQMLTQAILPFYLIHQTIIVVAGHHLDELRLSLWLEAPILIGATALGCWLFFDLGRRIPWLRVWIGLDSKRRPIKPHKGKAMNARLATLVSIAGTTLAVLFPVVAGAFHPGYDHARQFISELGADGAPNADVVNWLGFLPAGVLLTLFPVLAWRALPQAPLTTIGLFGIALYAVGYVSAAFLPCDAGCRPASPSTTQLLHNTLGLVGYLTAPVSLFLLAWQARGWTRGGGVALAGAVSGVAAFCGLATFSPEAEFAGVSQRLIEGAMLGWILVCGLYVWTAPRAA